MALTLEQANELLPQGPTSSVPDPNGLVYLIIGPPKWGKTSWACNIPDALLLAFEQGHKFQSANKIVIDKWAGKHEMYDDADGARHMTMVQVEEILRVSDRFSTVIFDTADMAAKACSDYYQSKNGWAHISDGGDYGKGYDIAQNTPFRQMVGSIMKTGRGVVFLTHSAVKETQFKKAKAAKKETTLPGGIHKFIHTQADVILHGSFGAHRKGRKNRDRILQTSPDEETLAGCRTKGINLPVRFIVDEENPWQQWCNFFTDPEAADLATLQLSGSAKEDIDNDEDEDEPEKGEANTEAVASSEEQVVAEEEEPVKPKKIRSRK